MQHVVTVMATFGVIMLLLATLASAGDSPAQAAVMAFIGLCWLIAAKMFHQPPRPPSDPR